MSFNLTGTGDPERIEGQRFPQTLLLEVDPRDRPHVHERRGPAGGPRVALLSWVVATQVRRRQQYRRPVAQPQR